MSTTKIMTDSACDIPKEIETELQIKILNFPVTVGDESFIERVDFTEQEFYDILLSSPKIPATSQITYMQFYDEFKAVYEQGYNDLIYVSINKKGSATHDNAVLAREKLYQKHPEIKEKLNIHIIDSRTYTVAYGYPVAEAARKAIKGVACTEIVAFLQDYFASVVVYFSPLKLDFAKKSGRISCAAAFVGELIGLKPIIRIMDGEMKIVEKVRGDKALIAGLIKYASGDIVPQTPYLLVKGMGDTESENLREAAKKEFSYDAVGEFPVGAAIAINAGPQVIGIIVKSTNRN